MDCDLLDKVCADIFEEFGIDMKAELPDALCLIETRPPDSYGTRPPRDGGQKVEISRVRTHVGTS